MCITLLAVRNSFRKLPFHLARERGLQQLMSLVDPRIPIDVALDAARWAPRRCSERDVCGQGFACSEGVPGIGVVYSNYFI